MSTPYTETELANELERVVLAAPPLASYHAMARWILEHFEPKPKRVVSNFTDHAVHAGRKLEPGEVVSFYESDPFRLRCGACEGRCQWSCSLPDGHEGDHIDEVVAGTYGVGRWSQ